MAAPLGNLCISHLCGRDTSIQGTLFLIPRASHEWKAPLYSAVVKISSCQANGTSRWGIQQLGILFGSSVFLFYFPTKVDGGHVHNSG